MKSLLRDQIEQAFARVPHPGDENIVGQGEIDDPETEQIKKVLSGRKWQDVSLDVIHTELNQGFIWFLTPKALQFYLPSLLTIALDEDGVWQTGSTLIMLLSPEPEGALSRANVRRLLDLNAEQTEVVGLVLESIWLQAPILFQNYEHMHNAVDFWRSLG